MILEISPDSSPVVRVAAAAILYLHIGAGLVALVAGAGALAFRKGSRLHRISGDVFVVAMLIMASIGAAVSPFLKPPQWANVAVGVFTLYLVVTGWMAVRRRDRPVLLEKVAFSVGVAIALGGIAVGAASMNSANTAVASNPRPAFAFAAIAALAAAGDLRWLLNASASAVQRTVRHLWRMCFALLIAAVSLFLGQPQVFPEPVRGTGLLFLPVLTVLLLMIYWIVRVRFIKKRNAAMYAAS